MKVIYNATIHAPDYPKATALLIHNGAFIALGSDTEILEGFPRAETTLNLEGKTLWPGLIDAHVHLRHLAESMGFVNCETDSMTTCVKRVQEAVARAPGDAWIRGHGWNHNRWVNGYGTAAILDAVSGGHPVYLTAKSLHAAWVNSEALRWAGITADTADPPGGMIQRDGSGRPTGILFENAMKLIEDRLPELSQEMVQRQIAGLIPELWKLGLVGVHDFDGLPCWQALQSLHQEGALKFRVCKNIPFEFMERFTDAGLRTGYGDDRLHIGSVKLFADGALGPQTAAMLEPYAESAEKGALLLSHEEIFSIGKQAVEHGLGLAIHAIGDLANRTVLNALQQLRSYEEEKRLPHHSHRIEHVQIIHPQDLPRLAALDIVASVQPIHAPSDMYLAEKKLGSRAQFSYAYGSLRQTGGMVICGSDAPVEPVNPFLGLHAAVTRRRLDGSPGPEGWFSEQRLPLTDALSGFSFGPARVIHRGDRLGKIAPGYRADFIILENNPFRCPSDNLGRILPLATFIDGECVFQDPQCNYSF